MKLIHREWNAYLNKYQNFWLANTQDDVTADCDPDGAEGSTILVISTGVSYMKNATGEWQKFGGTEVIA